MKYLIIGGGIAGLYCAYTLIKLGIIDIKIIEKEKRLGGRIETLYINDFYIELGAGTVAEKHKRFLKLIKELGLENELFLGGKRDRLHIESKNGIKNVKSLKKNGFYDIIENLLNELDNKEFYELAKNYSLYRLIERKYNIEIAEKMKNEFGYTEDFIKQNAIDGLNMFKISFNKDMKYYKLKNGLGSVINKLSDFIKERGVEIKLDTECINVTKKLNNYICLTNQEYINAENIIFAIPSENLSKIKILDNINEMIDSVYSKSLMRIYAIFPLTNEGKVWFDKINSVITTNGILRQIISINKEKGVIMISYSDSNEADTWNFLNKSNLLEKELMFEVRRLFSNVNIPDPIKIYSKYWKNATHMWKPTIDSKELSKKIIKPIENENIYIIGESYSLNQQWTEGALETVDNFIKNIK